jgi:hypothetical protein
VALMAISPDITPENLCSQLAAGNRREKCNLVAIVDIGFRFAHFLVDCYQHPGCAVEGAVKGFAARA